MNKSLSLVFGLSADPVHVGHEASLAAAIGYLKQQSSLAEVIIVPVYAPNLIAGKQGPKATYQQRLHMCQLLARKLRQRYNTNITVSRIEERNYQLDHRLSYTYDTLDSLNKKALALLVNADHFSGVKPKFEQWYLWQEIIQKYTLIICQRPGYEVNMNFVQQLQNHADSNIHVIPEPMPDVSSTVIRKKIKENPYHIDLKNLLDKNIYQYINKNHIYHSAFINPHEQ